MSSSSSSSSLSSSLSLSSSSSDPNETMMKQIKKDVKNFDEIYYKKCSNKKYVPSIIPQVDRIIVIGDIHGDYKVFIEMLTIGKLINSKLEWIGGKTHVVQIGDQIDSFRGDRTKYIEMDTKRDLGEDIKIMELCNKLNDAAILSGGMFISLLGNHEIMNANGDMRYVSYKNVMCFDNYKDTNCPDMNFKNPLHARVHAFAPGNEYANMMGCTRVSSVIIGSHLFVHAGIINSFIDEIGIEHVDDLESINKVIKLWMFGLVKDRTYMGEILNSPKSMFWTRILGEMEPNLKLNDCKEIIGKSMKLFKVNNVIVGHTPQSISNRDINGTCDNTIIRVDNGSSYAFDGMGDIPSRRVQVLEILHDFNSGKDSFFIIDRKKRVQMSISEK